MNELQRPFWAFFYYTQAVQLLILIDVTNKQELD